MATAKKKDVSRKRNVQKASKSKRSSTVVVVKTKSKKSLFPEKIKKANRLLENANLLNRRAAAG
jgi:hypothetical protein